MSSDRKEHSFRFSGLDFSFITDNGVFSKTKVDEGTQYFLEVLQAENLQGSVLDLGCGYGAIAVVLKRLNPDLEVSAADINPRAVELAGINADRNHVRIQSFVSDGFAGIYGIFDNIVTNPPIRAGKQVVYGMLRDAYTHLDAGGNLYAVIRRQQGAESAVKELVSIYGNCAVEARKKGYWILHSYKLTD